MKTLPMSWESPVRSAYGGLITPDGNRWHRNIMRNQTDYNARLKVNNYNNEWSCCAAKWLADGGAIILWEQPERLTAQTLDLTDDKRKKMHIIYNFDKLSARLRRTLESCILDVDEHVENKKTMLYYLHQAHVIQYAGKNTVELNHSFYRGAKFAAIHVNDIVYGLRRPVKSDIESIIY